MSSASNRYISAIAVLLGLMIAVTMYKGTATAAEPSKYRIDFVSSPASGNAMNDQGIVAGVQLSLPLGCSPSTCAPASRAVVWSGNTIIPLPVLAGYSAVTAVGINASGWVAGYAGDPTRTGARAVVWKPAGTSYTAIDLGVLPGTSSSWAAGIDDFGRAVGWSTDRGAFPKTTAPFGWSEANGMIDLAAHGFPNDIPLAISPGGTVATSGHWYRLDNPGSVTALAPPPPGFSGPGSYPTAINEAGDQVRFQISTSTQNFPYLFRYDRAGIWQQIWFAPAGNLAPFGVGSISAAREISATVGGEGLVAYGPNGLGERLAGKLSPVYGANDVTIGGPMDASGQILTQVMIGLSQRLVRLVPTEPCTTNCIRVASIQMEGKFIHDPQNPGQCTRRARDLVSAKLTVTDEAGMPVSGALVTGRFLDEYYLNRPVIARTNGRGVARFVHRGPVCVGAISILIDGVAKTGRVLDFTSGTLTNYVIPVP